MIKKIINSKISIVSSLLFFFLSNPIAITLAAPHPDLLTQLNDLEVAIINASDDDNQLMNLITQKINTFPNDAVFIAAFAAYLVPDKAPGIAKTAANIVPDSATEIAFAVSYAVPDSSAAIKDSCSAISPNQNSDITIAGNVAVNKRNTSGITFDSALQLAQTAVNETDLFMQNIISGPPSNRYGL